MDIKKYIPLALAVMVTIMALMGAVLQAVGASSFLINTTLSLAVGITGVYFGLRYVTLGSQWGWLIVLVNLVYPIMVILKFGLAH